MNPGNLNYILQTPILDPSSDEAWNRFKVSSYEPVRSEHVKKLRRGRHYGRTKRSSDKDDDINETHDDHDEKKIKERAAVYPKHSKNPG